MALGLHPRERKSSATRRLGGLLVGVAAKAPRAVLVCLSVQGRADQTPGGDMHVALVCLQPQGRADRAPWGLPPSWRPCPPTQSHPCQTVQFTVKSLTIHLHLQCSRVQFTISLLTINSISRYSEH